MAVSSTCPGSSIEPRNRLQIGLQPGRYATRSAYVEIDDITNVVVIQLCDETTGYGAADPGGLARPCGGVRGRSRFRSRSRRRRWLPDLMIFATAWGSLLKVCANCTDGEADTFNARVSAALGGVRGSGTLVAGQARDTSSVRVSGS